MIIKAHLLRCQDAALCFVRKWWRPATCVGIALGTIVNIVLIPLVTWTPVNLAEAAAYITACAAAFGVRAFEKWKGVTNDA